MRTNTANVEFSIAKCLRLKVLGAFYYLKKSFPKTNKTLYNSRSQLSIPYG